MKKIVSLILASLLIFSVSVFAAEFKDMPNDWSTPALEAAVKNGLLTGSNGYIKASDNMTRAEMATIMVRACGATEEADISSYKDVKKDDWFYSSMAKAVKMGAFQGSDGKLNPQNPITRQEAFLVLTRVFGLDKNLPGKEDSLRAFKDSGKVADWAKEGVGAIVQRGYVAGSDGYINPLNNISRAEFATVMDRLIKYYIDSPEAEIPTDGNVMIRCKIENISGLKTSHMVVLGDAVGDATVNFVESEISGKVALRGGKVVNFDSTQGYTDISILSPGIKGSAYIPNVDSMKIYLCKDSVFAPTF